MTTQGEHGENPHQAVGVGALDDPKKQTRAASRSPTGMIVNYSKPVGTGVLDCSQK